MTCVALIAFDSTSATNAELDLKQQEVDASRNSKLVIECAAGILPERVEWLWPGRLAIGKHSLLAGEAGLGKSQITISMAAAVTTAGPWPSVNWALPVRDCSTTVTRSRVSRRCGCHKRMYATQQNSVMRKCGAVFLKGDRHRHGLGWQTR
jgi:hypothetical protein